MNSGKERISPFKGFEITKNNIRLSLKMHFWLLVASLVLFLVLVGYWFYLGADKGELAFIFRYLWAQIFGGYFKTGGWEPFTVGGKTYTFTNEQLLSPQVVEYAIPLLAQMKTILLWKGGLCLIPVTCFYYGLYRLFGYLAQRLMAPKHLRGTRLITEKELAKEVRRGGQPFTFHVGKVPIPAESETQSILLAGASGSGKTQTINPMIAAVQRNNRRGLVYDHKGDFTAKMYRTGKDRIWNPLDARSVKWTLFNDIRTLQDVHKMAHSLIPDRGEHGASGHFRHAARDLFIASLLHCWQTGKRTNRELWQVLSSPIEELQRLFGESVLTERGAVHIQDAKLYAQSVVGTMMPLVSVIEWMQDGDFSVDTWLNDIKNPNLIFIGSRPDFEDFIRPAMGLFVDFAGTRLLSLPDDHDRRMYFFMDEFPSIGYLPSIPKLLSTGRSKGFCGVLAAQTNAQIVRHYSEHVAAEIVNGCATYAVYNLRDPKSAKYFADAIGEHEVEYKTESTTWSVQENGAKDGGGLNGNRRKEHAVMPEELKTLPRLTSILKLADFPNPATVKIPLSPMPNLAPSYVERADMNLLRLIESARKAREMNQPPQPSPESKRALSNESQLEGWLGE